MPSRDDFLKTIRERPEDDGPRLVYADWLDEHGDPDRAELIRVQCVLASLSPDAPSYVDLQEREKELTACVRWAPTEGLPPVPGVEWDTTPERGFPAAVIIYHNAFRAGQRKLENFVTCLEHVAAHSPVRHVQCYHFTPELLAELLGSPILQEYTGLTLRGSGDEEACRLAASRHVRNLRCLHLHSDLGEEGLAALARSPHLGRLGWFALDSDWPTSAEFAALESAPWLAELRRLYLRNRRDNSVRGLAGWPALPHLHTFVLEHVELSPASRRALVRPGAFPQLARLTLTGCKMGADGVEDLGLAQEWPLSELRLSWAQLGTAGAIALAQSPRVGSLRSLELAGNGIDPSGVVALARSPQLARLRHLDIGVNDLGPEGLSALTESPHLKGLTSLNLGPPTPNLTPITAADVRRFLASLELPRLRHLDLSGLPVGARGAKALAANPNLSQLTMLTLIDCCIPDNGVRELLDSPYLQGLVRLDLRLNPAGAGLKPLADPKVLPRLGDCQFHTNRQANSRLQNRIQARLRTIS